MSLSAADRQVLSSIEAEFVSSDPKLTSMLGTFTRLAADEDMPKSEQIPARTPRRAISWPRLQLASMGFWVIATLALIAVVAAGINGGYTPCQHTVMHTCTSPVLFHRFPSSCEGCSRIHHLR